MNFSDSEIVASILQDIGYATTKDIKSANLILINTCSIREKAEQTVRRRLNVFRATKNKNTTIGILGCMAERLKSKFLDHGHLPKYSPKNSPLELPKLSRKDLARLVIKISLHL